MLETICRRVGLTLVLLIVFVVTLLRDWRKGWHQLLPVRRINPPHPPLVRVRAVR